jgi:hypothetical protein
VFTKTADAHESTPTQAFNATIEEIFFLRQSALAEITVCRRIDKVTVLHGSPLISHGVKPKKGMKPINLGGFRIDLNPRPAVREPLFHINVSQSVSRRVIACGHSMLANEVKPILMTQRAHRRTALLTTDKTKAVLPAPHA